MGYSVFFPGTPEKDTYKDNGGSYVRYSTVDKNDNINYAVSTSQFSSKQTEESKEFSESQRRKVLSNYAHLMGVKEGEYTFTTVDGHTAITYMGHASEDSSVILRRTVVFSPAGFYGLEAFGVPQKEYKQFVDTFQLSEDTQEWKDGFHDFGHWLYLLPGDARPGLDGSRHGGRDRSGDQFI